MQNANASNPNQNDIKRNESAGGTIKSSQLLLQPASPVQELAFPNILIKMLKYVVLVALFALATAAPQQRNADKEVTIVRSEATNNDDGSFSWLSELSDGSRSEQSGFVKDPQSETPAIQIKGSYSYTSPEGQPISITYTANELGFQPVGDHLPTPPPIPEAIQKALDIIYKNAAAQTKSARN